MEEDSDILGDRYACMRQWLNLNEGESVLLRWMSKTTRANIFLFYFKLFWDMSINNKLISGHLECFYAVLVYPYWVNNVFLSLLAAILMSLAFKTGSLGLPIF